MGMLLPMTSPTPNENARGSLPKPAHPAQVVQDREIVVDAAPSEAGSPGSFEDQTPTTKPLSGEVVVDYNGTPRRVRIEDLVSQARAAENAQALEAAANAALSKAAAAQQIASVYASLPENRRRALEAALKDHALLDRIQGGQQQPQADGFSFEEPESRGGHDPRVDQLQELLTKQVIPVLAGLGQERMEQTTRQQVEVAMKEWPVFETDPALAEMARTNILNAKALNPDKGVASIVAETATTVARLLQGRRAAGAPVGQGRTTIGAAPENHPKFSAKDLRNGNITRYVRDQAGLL